MIPPLTLALHGLLDAPHLRPAQVGPILNPGLNSRLSARAEAEGWEPEGWREPEDDYEIDLLDSHPDAETDAEAPTCARCCGTGQEIAAATGELDSCRDCGGTGLAEPWRDPDYAVARLLNELYEEAWGSGDDPDPDWAPTCRACACGDSSFPLPRCRCACHGDPDPGDGGLGLPPLQAQGWAAEVEAEACPGCGRPSPHLYAGATCAGCLLFRSPLAGRAA